MDTLNKKWLKGKRNFYFRYKYEVVEGLIEGTCLNVGCGEHKIKGAKNVDYPSVDATRLPYKDKSFDTVILSDVIEHIDIYGSIQAVQEAFRVCNKKVIITVPADWKLWSKYDVELGHFRRYDKLYFDFIVPGLQIKEDKFLLVRQTYLFGLLYPLFYLRKFTSGKTPVLPNWIDNLLYKLSKVRLNFGSTLLVELEKC
jgi:hypothetical protein